MEELGPRVGVFRASVRSILPLCLLPGAATAPMVIRGILFTEDLTLLAALVLVLLLPGSVLLSLLLLWPLLRVFAVRLHELGVRGHSVGGRPIAMAWHQVSQVEARTLLWFDYLRVTGADPESVLWLPRFLADQGSFDALLVRHAGAAHPISVELGSAAV